MRSCLFVPGNRPDRFDKAMRSASDMVVLDVNEAFAPGEDAIAWARKVLDVMEPRDVGAAAVDGEVDRPVVESARRIPARAGVVRGQPR